MMLVGAAVVAGCASTPRTQAKRDQLEGAAADAREAMLSKDPSVRALMDQSYGYIIFPEVKEGGFVVGGAGAEGVIYQQGRVVGYATLSRGSFGAQVGGQKYAELVAAQDRGAFERLKAGNVDFGARSSAVILRAGAAATSTFGDNGIAVVVDPIGGAMVNASLTGQRIRATM